MNQSFMNRDKVRQEWLKYVQLPDVLTPAGLATQYFKTGTGLHLTLWSCMSCTGTSS